MESIPTLVVLLRILLTTVLCALIGLERQYRHKPAGLRTNILVGIGTTVMTIVSIEIARLAPDPSSVDISRIMSTILTGIGFIGAGTIIREHGSVQGLTTAASIWVVVAIGMATGMGLYAVAGITAVITPIVLVILEHLKIEEEKFPPR